MSMHLLGAPPPACSRHWCVTLCGCEGGGLGHQAGPLCALIWCKCSYAVVRQAGAHPTMVAAGGCGSLLQTACQALSRSCRMGAHRCIRTFDCLHGLPGWPGILQRRLCPIHIGSQAHCKFHATEHHPRVACRGHTSRAVAATRDWEWSGLAEYRAAAADRRRGWGERGPTAELPAPAAAEWQQVPLAPSLADVALQVLNTAEPVGKAALTHRAWLAYTSGALPLGIASQPPPTCPARPPQPQLVAPKLVPSPKDTPLPLAAYMLHNLAHIELNAIDLAWDTVARFSHLELPPGFYEDFARVADDESRHFGWCLQRLQEMGWSYGDMPAHDLLWQGAQASAHDLNARLAVVPMSQEARGLDAGQRLVERLVGAGDPRSAAIVRQIALEEKAHVAVGVAWFQRVCSALDMDAQAAFRGWLADLGPDLLKGPFNHDARQEVGLPRDWYDVQQWPIELQQGMVSPKEAAAARGRGATEVGRVARRENNSSSSGPGGERIDEVAGSSLQQQARSLPARPEQLQQLRHRLLEVLGVELVATV